MPTRAKLPLLLFALSSCATEKLGHGDDTTDPAPPRPTSILTPSAQSPVVMLAPSGAESEVSPVVSAPTISATPSTPSSTPTPEPSPAGGAPSVEPMGGAGGEGIAGRGGDSAFAGAGAMNAGSGGTLGSAGDDATGGSLDAGAASAGSGGSGAAPYNPCPPMGEPCVVVPFGDSITDGFNVPGGYRMELFHLALEAGQSLEFAGSSTNGPPMVDGVPFPQNHEGHSGYTIEDAPQVGRSGILPLVDTVLGFEPDIILLKIGTNDLDNDVDVRNAPARLGALLDDIFAKDDDVLVVVAQIIPSRDAALNQLVAAYNDGVADEVAARAEAGAHVLLADMESAFLADSSYQTTLLADALHPNEAGYAVLGATWYGVIGALLR